MAVLKRVRKDGGASYQVVVDRREAGRRNQTVIGTFRTKKEAVRAERKALDEIEQGRYVLRSTTTINELIAQWILHKKATVAPRTVSEYESISRLHILPSLGKRELQKLKPITIQQWVDKLEVGDRTRHRALNILSQAYGFGVRMGIAVSNPCDHVTVRQPVPSKRTLWTDEQYHRFLDIAEDDTYACLWHLLCVTGMRFGEAAGLRWVDIDWEASTVSVRQIVVSGYAGNSSPTIKPSPKTDSSYRTIPVAATTLDLLRSNQNSHELVSCYASGKPLQHSGMVRKLKTLCKIAGVPYIPPHSIRHLHATNLARAGVPLRVAMDRLGHRTPDVLLRIYQHVDQGMATDAVDKMTALLGR